MIARWLALLALVVCLMVAGAVWAQGARCPDRETVLRALKSQYGEEPAAIAVTNQGGLLEVLTSPGGATWSIVISKPGHCTRIVASGESWHWVKTKPQEL